MWKLFWLIWLVLSSFIIIIYGWSLRILYQQKKAWREFATKHKLEYKPGRLTESPIVSGRYQNKRFYLYTGVKTVPDIRGQRFVTIIEIELGRGVPVAGVAGTQDMETFISNLNFENDFAPNSQYWEQSFRMRTNDIPTLHKYMTEERLQALKRLFSLKNSAVLFFFDEIDSVLRIETSDPLRDANHIERVLGGILKNLTVLKLSDEEFTALGGVVEKKPALQDKAEQESPPEQEKPEQEKGGKKKPAAEPGKEPGKGQVTDQPAEVASEAAGSSSVDVTSEKDVPNEDKP